MGTMKINKAVSKRFIAGDEAAFAEVYQTFKRPLFFFLSSYLSRKEDVEDAFQETFLRVLDRRSSLSSPEGLSSYLFLVARSVAMDFLRKEEPSLPLDEENLGYVPGGLDDFLPYDLSEEEKAILGYRLVFGFSWQQVSEITHIPLSTAKAKYAAALKSVKGALRS